MEKLLANIFALLQIVLPHHLLSRLTGYLAASEITWLKNSLISLFIKVFKVDMSEAVEEDPKAFANFNAFFTRAIKPERRPLCTETEAIACPADGAISQLGDIEDGHLLQAKGHFFSLTELLGGDDFISQNFAGGKFVTIYLSPQDYHRVHMPFDGQLQTMVHVPGRLFSVNNATTRAVPNLFARNERVVSVFDTSAGPMAIVLVGAMIVAGIETQWAGQIAPPPKTIRTTQYPNVTSAVSLAKGDEMGLFKLGSTAIVLFGPDMVEWEGKLTTGSSIKMGERLGYLINA